MFNSHKTKILTIAITAIMSIALIFSIALPATAINAASSGIKVTKATYCPRNGILTVKYEITGKNAKSVKFHLTNPMSVGVYTPGASRRTKGKHTYQKKLSATARKNMENNDGAKILISLNGKSKGSKNVKYIK